LRFNSSGLGVDESKNNKVTILNNLEGFDIKANRVVHEIKIYDMLGRLLLQNNPNKQNFKLKAESVKNGTIVIIKMTFENNSSLCKRLIK